MTFALAIKLLLFGSLFLIVFSLALRARLDDALYMFTHLGAGLRAFMAIFVIVPVVAVLIVLAFDLPQPVKIALICLALSPLPPVLPGKLLKAGGEFDYVIGLLFGSAVVSLVAAPLGLMLVDLLAPADLSLRAIDILPPIVTGIALPLVLGMIGRHLLGGQRADSWAPSIARFATLALVVAFVGLLIAVAPSLWEVLGDGTLLALSAMILAGMLAGWWFAGNGPGEKAVLALAASSRHPGVAIAIATTNFPDEKLASAAIIVGLLLSIVLSVPFMRGLTTGKAKPA